MVISINLSLNKLVWRFHDDHQNISKSNFHSPKPCYGSDGFKFVFDAKILFN